MVGDRSAHLWRNREFGALTAALMLSVAGDDLARIALAIVFYNRSHSALLAAVTFGISFMPALFVGPVLSPLGDRFARRNVMVVCDVARTALVGLATLAVLWVWPPLWALGLLFAA